MREVSKEEFFRAMSGDVHPRVDVASLKHRYHISDWETRDRRLLGRSESDSHGGGKNRYWLVDKSA